MKTIFTILAACLLITNFACSEKKEQTESDSIIEKLNSGNGNAEDVDKLLESISDKKGSYEVSIPKAKFELTFPVLNVEESTTTQLIENKEVEIFHYSANMQDKEDENLAYQIDYVFLPEIKSKEAIDDLFNGQRDYVISATNSKLEFEKIISKNGTPGRHLYLTADRMNAKINYHMYFKDGIFYKLTVVTHDDKLFNKSISTFFDSFRITK